MIYRTNRRTGDRISVIGLGGAYMVKDEFADGAKAIRRAYEAGVNYFDTAGDIGCFEMYGEALGDVRSDIMYQVHFGANYTSGAYGWTTRLDDIKRSIEWQFERLRTDYIDYGFIHCMDERSDWDAYRKNGVFDHILRLKEQGVVRHIGLSSHTPGVINTILDTGVIDMLMFSVNPAYDYQQGEYARGGVDERSALYRRCESEGIGISVMKPFSGGQLLSAAQSPFKCALTQYQCIEYALDKPGVLTVLPGIGSMDDVNVLLGYCDAPESERDYSVIGTFAPAEAAGKCVYCNHCQPCPAGLDVALINKYYDLARVGDAMAVQHYAGLDKKADDCIACGHCNRRCPFGVDQAARMREIAEYFK